MNIKTFTSVNSCYCCFRKKNIFIFLHLFIDTRRNILLLAIISHLSPLFYVPSLIYIPLFFSIFGDSYLGCYWQFLYEFLFFTGENGCLHRFGNCHRAKWIKRQRQIGHHLRKRDQIRG